jgi:hypothetical protein
MTQTTEGNPMTPDTLAWLQGHRDEAKRMIALWDANALALSLPEAVAHVQEWRESHKTLDALDKALIEALEAAQAKPAKEAENASK